MEPTRAPQPTRMFGRRITVETPEHVVLELELAGVGSRVAAAAIDQLLIAMLLVIAFGAGLLVVTPLITARADTATGVLVAVLVFLWFAATWGYYALFEGLGGGRTPGKRRLGIRVVMVTGRPVTFPAAVARNLVRLVDFQPANAYLVGLAMIFFQRHQRRLGDLVAGTVVIHDRVEEISLAPSEPDVIRNDVDAGPPVLDEDEFGVLGQFIARLDRLPASTRSNVGATIASRFADRAGRRETDPEAFLVALYDDELAKRRAKSATRRGSSGTIASGTAVRFIALRQPTWEAFHQRTRSVEQRGIKNLLGSELTQYAADYRAVTADLARARTYGVDQRVLANLERIVSMGHHALYGFHGVRRLPVKHVLLETLPTAAYRARRLIAAAMALFLVSGYIGFQVVREQPDVIYSIMPSSMIQRAEIGADEIRAGRGYAESPSPYLPIVASTIITNNIQVAFAAFAFGITAGVGTVMVLVFNGLFFGSVLGMFANYGLAGWLLRFVAGHGVLELTAIFIASAAGLLLGKAIVLPGDVARRDALAVHGREAIKLVAAAASLLVLAGVIEGLLSASSAPTPFKVGVGAASALLVALYFWTGRDRALSGPTLDTSGHPKDHALPPEPV